jgi:hypothetical protein
MRLWSLHPKYLDPQGLVALWREALLAQAVLRGRTRGYRRHPQLTRFQQQPSPLSAINAYLAAIHAEASARGYAFDRSKIGPARKVAALPVTAGQLQYEWSHLMAKLAVRAPALRKKWRGLTALQCHPLFRLRPGGVAEWERTESNRRERREKPNR